MRAAGAGRGGPGDPGGRRAARAKRAAPDGAGGSSGRLCSERSASGRGERALPPPARELYSFITFTPPELRRFGAPEASARDLSARRCCPQCCCPRAPAPLPAGAGRRGAPPERTCLGMPCKMRIKAMPGGFITQAIPTSSFLVDETWHI